MRLCPIAPPKGFPLALWKPSGENISFLKHQVYELDSLLMLFLSDCKAIRIWEVKEP